jgi:peptidoglycan hydrolase-like amidase
MSQWGAKARDDAGQTYLQILSAYYPGGTISNGKVWNQDITEDISVQGHGTMPLETYLLGIREINGTWNNTNDMNVLKAQVIAARTYAVRYTSNGQKSICTTQSCQVYSSSHYTGAWATAVSQTAGQVLVDSAKNPVLTQYAAVHGGWINGVGWDTTDKKGGQSGWTANAWDSKSGVTWFYKSWNVYSPGMGACGAHSSPWLSNEEMADIINTWLALKGNGVKSSFNSSRILPVTLSSCPISGLSGDPYSMSELRGQLNSPVTSVSGVAVVASTSSGSTITINFTTNRGTFSIPASEFHEAYNSRAPGYLSIPQNGFTHLDVRKK